MKIDGITLLQMIKDEKIKSNISIEVSGGFRSHFPYIKFGENKRLYWENKDHTIDQAVLTDDLLEYEFEIIEDKPKKIESLVQYNDGLWHGVSNEQLLLEKIEELRNAINCLLEKSDKEC